MSMPIVNSFPQGCDGPLGLQQTLQMKGGGLLGLVTAISRRYHGAMLVVSATMVSTFGALVMAWYSLGSGMVRPW